ncbi:hypothetical protein PG1C_09145 [Rugosibacter aromaticivorans]|uniref:Uncharacterized protein n=1 Tax=Rugosibacter aromaticivorans TaxID=1565605 RepID=A0A0C5JMH3_9PROT|nr:hypothetical protein [Rugosibacter aromaticivorans]AJP48566.1 hypothetical protein PG1C_09145 [Rugosibacter aromaticivorans]TBR13109.1 MAG: hypothetical protein EPO43_11660 [Rugosibacter sp.]
MTAFVAKGVEAKQASVLGNPVNRFSAIARAIVEDHSLREQLTALDVASGTFGDLLRNTAMSAVTGSVLREGSVVPFPNRTEWQGLG